MLVFHWFFHICHEGKGLTSSKWFRRRRRNPPREEVHLYSCSFTIHNLLWESAVIVELLYTQDDCLSTNTLLETAHMTAGELWDEFTVCFFCFFFAFPFIMISSRIKKLKGLFSISKMFPQHKPLQCVYVWKWKSPNQTHSAAPRCETGKTLSFSFFIFTFWVSAC